MKKKIIILIFFCIFLCGCSKVENLSYETMLSTFSKPSNRINVYRTGYKYSIPRGIQIDEYSLYNEVLSSTNATYYMYIDIVSYYNKSEVNHEQKQNSKYYKTFTYNDKNGYLDIALDENNKYLIEIMYNYAKIEVMVNEEDVNETILYAISVLKSVRYNDNVIKNILESNVFIYKEEDYNIFNTTSNDSNYLNYDNEYKDTKEENTYDSDLIN